MSDMRVRNGHPVRWLGAHVRALAEFTEDGFRQPGVKHVHAQKGDLGVVRMVDGEWVTVTWERHGTTTDVHELDIELA